MRAKVISRRKLSGSLPAAVRIKSLLSVLHLAGFLPHTHAHSQPLFFIFDLTASIHNHCLKALQSKSPKQSYDMPAAQSQEQPGPESPMTMTTLSPDGMQTEQPVSVPSSLYPLYSL